MTDDLPLTLQTAYADLLQRAANAAFDEAFPEDGTFTPKKIRGRTYWYFQVNTDQGRTQRYVGPETPELVDRIRRHKEGRQDEKDRQTVVSMLVRSAHLPRPSPEIGKIVAALARAGVFRLRGTLVGTTAYQTYAAMLGTRLSGDTIRTEDVDVAQFANVSVAVMDHTPPMLEVLKQVDPSFREIPNISNSQRVTMYRAATGISVDFLTPNTGPDTDAPEALPSLGTHAQPLRFLDFLIREPEPAVILHGTGIHVLVPAPERYAIHKLIVARRRGQGNAKTNKDLRQAEALLTTLARRRPHELRAAWKEAYGRGKTWRQLLGEGIALIDADVRDTMLKIAEARRSVVANLDLQFAAPVSRYDEDRHVLSFLGEAGGQPVRCSITREALEDHFAAEGVAGCREKFRVNRDKIEHLVRTKYLHWPIDQPGSVLLRSDDIPKLLQEVSDSSRPHRKIRR